MKPAIALRPQRARRRSARPVSHPTPPHSDRLRSPVSSALRRNRSPLRSRRRTRLGRQALGPAISLSAARPRRTRRSLHRPARPGHRRLGQHAIRSRGPPLSVRLLHPRHHGHHHRRPLHASDSTTTQVHVLYTRTALTPEGNDHVTTFTAKDKTAAHDWQQSIDAYLSHSQAMSVL